MKKKTPKELKEFYTGREFQESYFYAGHDLGSTCMGNETVFKVYSPLAEKIILRLYETGNDSPAFIRMELKAEGHGVWTEKIRRNLHGTYYDYEIHINGETNETWDPYARACGVNGLRSMVVELGRTNPEGWQEDTAPPIGTEQIIYETHVKEYSWQEAGGFPEAYRGKYKAFTCEDTTLHLDGIHPTGLAYLKELGVTHIQLMPVFDYGYTDEAGPADQFNWGYDPVNYNVPEGSYSSDPYHGEVRIRELKEAIQSLHKAGFRVIMDVVYNHTYALDSCFQRTLPWYYYRQMEDGSPSNGSACGNDIASERPMCSRYILDSVLYWIEEYHMDGFRFDLMGLLDVKLMNEIQSTLDRRYGIGEKLVFGEPWAASESPMDKGAVPALKKNASLLNERMGFFCDNTRDAIKGHVFYEEVPGFANGKKGLEKEILNSVCAWCGENEEVGAKAPSQVITYISAHDNLTLWDKMVQTMCKGAGFREKRPELLAAYKLAASICFTCQGTLFMLSGEEFLRTKEGDENSFRSPVRLNQLDWEQAYENEEIVQYYKGLIALRKSLPGLCDKSNNAYKRIFSQTSKEPGFVWFCVDNRGENSTCETLLIAYNATGSEKELTLPVGNWKLLLDDKSSLHFRNPQVICGSVTVAPVGAVILGKC